MAKWNIIRILFVSLEPMETNHNLTSGIRPMNLHRPPLEAGLKKRWFAIRLKYIRAEKFAPQVPEKVGRCFVPPVVTNLVFIYSDYKTLWEYRNFNLNGSHMGFMRNRKTWEPLTVRDRDMEIFMRICRASECPIVLTERPKVKLGDYVRVKDGPFKGAEGYVVRMRKSKRVLVDLGGVLWTATEFVSPDLLEVVTDEELIPKRT